MLCRSYHIAFVILSFLFISCDLFDTRDPEQPDSGNQTLPIAFTKEILFSNFRDAFQQKNTDEYRKLFSDTATHAQRFAFMPSASAGTRYSFSSWDKSLEDDYFRNIISSAGISSSFRFDLISIPKVISYQSDSAKYSLEYLLFVPHNRGGVTQQFVGNGDIYVSPDKNAIWRIYRWVDFETKKDSSWSELKGQFAK
ncbi:MAG: hypothetical protein Q8L88_07665 [Bacteroidota bacterium]|nr:hypothetical protein [Bacteroidota bacterium]